jgi:hypothetical protein
MSLSTSNFSQPLLSGYDQTQGKMEMSSLRKNLSAEIRGANVLIRNPTTNEIIGVLGVEKITELLANRNKGVSDTSKPRTMSRAWATSFLDFIPMEQVAEGEEEEEVTATYFESSVKACFLDRAPWILALLVANFFSQYIQSTLQYAMQHNTIVATFMTLIIGAGGNIAAQTSTVFIRLLASEKMVGEELNASLLKKYVVHELLVCSLIILMIVSCCSIYSTFTEWGCFYIPVTVGISLLCVCSIAAVISIGIPILVKRNTSLDPALLSAPLSQTVLDIAGGAIFLYVAKIIMIHWIPCGDLQNEWHH